MRSSTIVLAAATLAITASAATEQTGAGQVARRNVMILATGGTIAGSGEAGGHGYTSGQFKVEDLIAAVPNLDKLAMLRGEQVANVGSQDMNDKIWLQLAKRTNELLERKDVDAIVITHGTDTMEETAYFLNLVVKSDKPVVLVGSMRPATAISADGPANLYDAVETAADPGARGRGVLVVMNDQIFNARDLVKMNTTSLDTFASPDRGPSGFIGSKKVMWYEQSDKRHTSKSEFSVTDRNALPRVDIIYAHANMDDTMIKAALQAGAKGLVIAGVGDGNMSKAALDALKAAAKQGIVVVRSTRLPEGVVLRNAEVNDDESGFVASGELNPGKSRVLTQLALLSPNHGPGDVQRMFSQY
jgi:L-asparaginase